MAGGWSSLLSSGTTDGSEASLEIGARLGAATEVSARSAQPVSTAAAARAVMIREFVVVMALPFTAGDVVRCGLWWA